MWVSCRFFFLPHACYVFFCLFGFLALTEQQRFHTQRAHFVHFAWHQWHPLHMPHLKGWVILSAVELRQKCERGRDASWLYSPVSPRFLLRTHRAETRASMAEVPARGAADCCSEHHDFCSHPPARCCSARKTAVQWHLWCIREKTPWPPRSKSGSTRCSCGIGVARTAAGEAARSRSRTERCPRRLGFPGCQSFFLRIKRELILPSAAKSIWLIKRQGEHLLRGGRCAGWQMSGFN